MAEMKNPFAWYELMTTDVPAAARFYGAVVGWRAEDSGMPGLDYLLLYSGDVMVAGLMAQPEESRAAGSPPGWLGYVGWRMSTPGPRKPHAWAGASMSSRGTSPASGASR